MLIVTLSEMGILKESIRYSYNMPWFHDLNAHKADRNVIFWFDAPKQKACLIGGIQGAVLKFPYSAPFSMIEMFKECKNEELEQFVSEIDDYCNENHVDGVEMKLPPMIYDETNITKWLGALLRDGYQIHELELNFHIEIEEEFLYKKRLRKNGKKNLNRALQENYQLYHCKNEQEKENAYRIIENNRKNKNYYLSMSWDEVSRTSKHLNHDFFILFLAGNEVASAIVFEVTKDIWQVIYWGNLSGTDNMRPMNYLAYGLQRFYRDKGIKVLDIGPSMLNERPNYGLCDFKESIGCTVSSKFCLEKRY